MRIRAERASRFVDVLAPHLPLALFSGAALAVLRWAPMGRLPMIQCGFKRATGYPCPFCGTTRAMSDAAQGHAHEAWIQSPMGTALWFILLLIFAVNLYALVARRRIRIDNAPARLAVIVAAVVVLANWGYRLANGLR